MLRCTTNLRVGTNKVLYVSLYIALGGLWNSGITGKGNLGRELLYSVRVRLRVIVPVFTSCDCQAPAEVASSGVA